MEVCQREKCRLDMLVLAPINVDERRPNADTAVSGGPCSALPGKCDFHAGQHEQFMTLLTLPVDTRTPQILTKQDSMRSSNIHDKCKLVSQGRHLGPRRELSRFILPSQLRLRSRHMSASVCMSSLVFLVENDGRFRRSQVSRGLRSRFDAEYRAISCGLGATETTDPRQE